MARTVLIVEDEPNVAGLLSDALRGAGYEVTLTTASRAAARCAEIRPSTIVVDYLMPGLNGVQVVGQIRQTLADSTPPVILVSALSNVRDLAQQMGADAYLRKPFDVDAFVTIVNELSASRRM